MIKISATQLEAYRRFLSDKITLEQLRTQLLRLEPPSPLMAIGTAFHELLQADEITAEQCEPYFEYSDIKEARGKIDYRCKAFEFKLRKPMRTNDGEPVMVTGVADQLLPLGVVEYKTRFSPFTLESYVDSMQWRMYCELFDVDNVTYKVWELKRDEATNKCLVKSYNEFTMYVTPNNKLDLMNYITDFVNLLKALRIHGHDLFQIEVKDAALH